MTFSEGGSNASNKLRDMALTELEWRERAVRWKGVDSERPDHRQICPRACWDFDYSSHSQSLSWAHPIFFLSQYIHKIGISSKSKLQSMAWLWTTSQKWDSDRECCRRNLFFVSLFFFLFAPKSHSPSGNNTSVCLWGTNPFSASIHVQVEWAFPDTLPLWMDIELRFGLNDCFMILATVNSQG